MSTLSRRIGLSGLGLLLALSAVAHQEVARIAEFGGKGTATGQFSEQTAFFADAFGNLYVSDATYKRIQKFGPNGDVLLEIDNASLDGVTLRKPGAIAADSVGNLYVIDLDFVPIDDAPGRPVFYYGHVVRKFAPDGSYLDTFQYLPLTEKSPWAERASLVLTAEGELGALIQYGDLNRRVLLAVAPSGHLYVVDQETIYELDPSGEYVRHFGAFGGRQGETDRASSITIDATGNLYIADAANDRVVVFDAEGTFLRAFGTRGSCDGELREPTLIKAQPDGTLLVSDETVYTRVHDSRLPARRDDPSPTVPASALPPRYRFSSYRLYATLMRRVQRFEPDGTFRDKILLRFPTDSGDGWRSRLVAIGGDGRLYYQHPKSLRIAVYVPGEGVVWNGVHKTLTLSYDLSTLNQQIDNPDLDDLLGTEADYRSRGFLFRDKLLSGLVPAGTVGASAYGNLRFEYDWNERERIAINGGFYALESRSEQRFTAEAGLDPERSFPQDDQTLLSYNSAEFQWRWERTLNQDPFRYRTMTTFFNVTLGTVRNIEDAIAEVNQRLMRSRQRFLDWEIGLEYDLAPEFFATVSLLRGPARGGYNGYWTYIDETGALFARGFNEGQETRIQWMLEGYF